MDPHRAQRRDRWSAGELYEPYVGRWSRPVARQFLAWLALPAGKAWLDVGCGTGALSQMVLAHCHPASVKGVDTSPAFLDYAGAHVGSALASFEAADAQALPFDEGAFDAAVSGLVLNFVPEPARAVSEMARVVRPGGCVAVYVWDYAGEMQLMRHFWDAAAELDPAAARLDEGKRFPLCHPQALRRLLDDCGLQAVELRAIDISTEFQDFDDYWRPFLGGQGPAPGYAMSLDEEHRNRLRDRIRSRLPVRGNGTISLVARAWAARGSVSSN